MSLCEWDDEYSHLIIRLPGNTEFWCHPVVSLWDAGAFNMFWLMLSVSLNRASSTYEKTSLARMSLSWKCSSSWSRSRAPSISFSCSLRTLSPMSGESGTAWEVKSCQMLLRTLSRAWLSMKTCSREKRDAGSGAGCRRSGVDSVRSPGGSLDVRRCWTDDPVVPGSSERGSFRTGEPLQRQSWREDTPRLLHLYRFNEIVKTTSFIKVLIKLLW